MSHKKLKLFIFNVSVLGYFPLYESIHLLPHTNTYLPGSHLTNALLIAYMHSILYNI